MVKKTPAKKIAGKNPGGRRNASPFPFFLFPVSTFILAPLIQHLPRAGRRQNRGR